jgi:MoaA/NifB/PqqE/SkfB family radical SAM enzyme
VGAVIDCGGNRLKNLQNKPQKLRGLEKLPGFWFRRRILGQKLPLLASFKLTYRCNLSCLACPFHRRASENNGHMSWLAATQALDELHRRGTLIVVFEGGEPFLWKDGDYTLHDLIAYAKRLFLRVAVTTNGTFSLDCQADAVWVSLDGLRETHNRLRSGSFADILENLGATTHPRVMVHYTMNRENWPDLTHLCAFLETIPAVKGITVQLFYPYDQGETALALSPRERKLALENAIRLKKEFPLINSTGVLRRMIDNSWSCRDDLLINVDPDGTITQGCYVKSRGEIRCQECGFTPVAEATGALHLSPASLLAGWQAYLA